MALSSLVEASAESWKGGLPIKAVAGWGGAGEERERDELGDGVREGLKRVGQGFEQLAGGADLRSQQLLLTTLEALKAQRDLFLAFRELYARHDRESSFFLTPTFDFQCLARLLLTAFSPLFLDTFPETGLSVDPIPRLQKKIETSQTKLLAVQNAKKPSWEIEADKLAGTIEAAQAEVKGWLARRGVVRSMSVRSSFSLPSSISLACGRSRSGAADRPLVRSPPSHRSACGKNSRSSSTHGRTLW